MRSKRMSCSSCTSAHTGVFQVSAMRSFLRRSRAALSDSTSNVRPIPTGAQAGATETLFRGGGRPASAEIACMHGVGEADRQPGDPARDEVGDPLVALE